MAGVSDIFSNASSVSAIGNAINSIVNTSAVGKTLSQQTQQLRDKIAFDRKTMERQAAIRAEEVARQQMLARATGDLFAKSLGGYANAEGGIESQAGQLAQIFQSVLDRPAPASVAPAAVGPAADREAAMRAMQSGKASAEAGNLANVQAFGRMMDASSRGAAQNEQIAGLLRNFAKGSADVANTRMRAEEGRYFTQDLVKPQPSMLGDLFTALAPIGAAYANEQAAKDAASAKYALLQPGDATPSLSITSGYTGPKLGDSYSGPRLGVNNYSVK